jgi:hypothetical protein
MYLLCLESKKDKAGFILIKLIFGLNAAKQFLNQGINYTFIDQKIQIFRKFSNQHQKSEKRKKRQKIKKDLSGSNGDLKLNSSLDHSTQKSLSSESIYSEIDDKTLSELTFLKEQIHTFGFSKIIILMKFFGVSQSYIDHWVWLHLNMGTHSEKFISFHQLLCEVYNFSLSNESNPEFQKILKMLKSQA